MTFWVRFWLSCFKGVHILKFSDLHLVGPLVFRWNWKLSCWSSFFEDFGASPPHQISDMGNPGCNEPPINQVWVLVSQYQYMSHDEKNLSPDYPRCVKSEFWLALLNQIWVYWLARVATLAGKNGKAGKDGKAGNPYRFQGLFQCGWNLIPYLPPSPFLLFSYPIPFCCFVFQKTSACLSGL